MSSEHRIEQSRYSRLSFRTPAPLTAYRLLPLVIGFLAISVLGACDDQASYGESLGEDDLWEYEPNEQTVDGVRYLALVGPRYGLTPTTLFATASARTMEDGGRPFERLDHPPLAIRLYATAERTPPAVWNSKRSDAGECTASVESEPAGLVDRVTCRYDLHDVLGDSLDAGRYYFAVAVRLQDHSVEFHGGEGHLYADSLRPIAGPGVLESHLRFQGKTGLTNHPLDPSIVAARVRDREAERVRRWVREGAPWLETVVRAENVGDRRVQLSHSTCPIELHMYASAAREGEPVWSSGGRWCDETDLQVLIDAAPGQIAAFPYFYMALPVREVLGDSLPAARYYFSVDLSLGSEESGAGRVWDEIFRVVTGDAYLPDVGM